MSDPLGAVAEQAANTLRRLQRASADTRTAWDDAARAAFDGAHANPIEAELGAAVRQLVEAAKTLAAVLTDTP